MGCNSVRTKLPQKTLGQASISTLLGNFGQVCFLLKVLNAHAFMMFGGNEVMATRALYTT